METTPTAARSDTEQGWSGQRLGLPRTGPGAMAPLGRRVGALAIDWVACLLISVAVLRMPYPAHGLQSLVPNLVFFAENVLLVGTLGCTLGHRLLGMQVRRVDGRAPGIVGALLRSMLLLLVIPAVVWDADGRGFHDRIAGSVLVRTR